MPVETGIQRGGRCLSQPAHRFHNMILVFLLFTLYSSCFTLYALLFTFYSLRFTFSFPRFAFLFHSSYAFQ
jgi:hypothetical protein